jgi:hypothetical protein
MSALLLFGANLLESATVTVTSAATGQPVTRLYDRARSLPWTATSNAQQDIDIDLGATPGSYNALALANIAMSTQIQITRGPSFPPATAVINIAGPIAADPAILASLGGPFSDRYVRIRVLSGGVVPAFGELFLGTPRTVVLPPFIDSAQPGTLGNVARDVSPAGYAWAVKKGAPRRRLPYRWTGLDAADLATIEAFYTEIDQGAKPLFLQDELGTNYWVNCVTPSLAPKAVSNALYELPELAFEEAL